MKEWLINRIKAPFLNLERAAWTGFWIVLIGSPIYIYIFCKNILKLVFEVLISPSPIWVPIALAITCCVYICLKIKKILPLSTPSPDLREKFHVFWDKNKNMRCMNCGKPLKNSSRENYKFYCCDPQCNSKHVLKNGNGNLLSENEARKLLDF